MFPLMYRQRPAYPALIAAGCILVFGAFLVHHLRGRVEDGLADPSQVVAAGCFSCGVAGALVVAAFARYQFSHLWKRSGSSAPRKRKKARRR